MERIASVAGPDFFASAAHLLHVLLDVRFAFIAECIDSEAKTARTLAFWDGAGLAENVDFCAQDGPCSGVMAGSVVHVTQNASEKFPKNEVVQSLAPDSYFGCPLINSSGMVIGHIAAMDVRPLNPSPEDLVILRILASRAAAELERRQIEEVRTADLIRGSEERFRLAQEAAGIGTWDMDVTTGRGTWSDNYWGIYGLSPDSCTPGYEAWIELVHPEDREEVDARIKAALQGEAPYSSEFRILWPDGSVRWLVGKASVFRDDSGNPIRMIGVDYDVTERKEAQQTLQRMHDELELRVADRTQELSETNVRLEHEMAERERAEAERLRLERQMGQARKLESLGVLTGGVAHDFNNLLVTIMANAELALSYLAEDSSARDHVNRSVEAAERASELTQQLLSYSGKTQVSPKVLDLSVLVSDMADMLNVATGPKIELQLDLPKEPVFVSADATQVRQIVMNLITNAVEAMPEGGVVRIRTSTLDSVPPSVGRLYRSAPIESASYGFFSVSDVGTGLDRETCSKIFDPFFTSKFLGRGLGLAVVLGIVRSHQGVIAVDSDEESGTTFTTLLPAVNAETSRDDQPQVDSDWQVTGKVLVVDDDSAVCTTACAMLKHLGFETIEALGGREAVDMFERLHSEIRFVLLDHAMREMNGAETLLRLREINPDVPVIITSGYSETEIAMSSVEARPAGFLQKPYRLAHFREILRTTLNAVSQP
jgi:PAS domain S-box-containing protein